MEQNKTGKYFKYAIGEIILVVIGILIAIQANNWNVNRNAKIDLNQSLSKLLIELNQDELLLNQVLEMNDNYISLLDSCLIILKEPEKYSIDKFEKLFRNTNYTMTFEFSRVTFDELSISGKLKQLDNTKLSDSLVNYYGNTRYKSVEDALSHHVRDNIRTYTLGFDYLNFEDIDNYNASDFNIKKKTLLDYSSDIRIINSIRLKIVLHRFIGENYKAIIPNTEFLVKTIEEELKSK